MEVINNTEKPQSDDIEKLLSKTAQKHGVQFKSASIESIYEKGLTTIFVNYSGMIELKDLNNNPIGNPELYSSTLGDVSLLGFSDERLKLEVYDRA